MATEMTDEDMFNKYMEEQKAKTLMTPLQPPQASELNQPIAEATGISGQTNTLSFEEQTAINSLQNQTAPPVNEIKPTHGACPQCGTIHPPTGEKSCPNASIKALNPTIDDGKVNTYLVQWRNIMLSHIQKLNIEGWEKEFQKATLMFAKEFDGIKK